MFKTNITEEEKTHVREYAKTSPLLLVRLKAQAVLMASKGMSPADSGDIHARAERTIAGWLRGWNNRRLASLFTGHRENTNAAKLPKAQLTEMKEILAAPPHEHGLPGSFWNVPKLKAYVEASFGVIYESDRTYHFLLRFGNLSFKYPDTFDRKRDLSLIGARMREIQIEIVPLLKSPDWEVFCVDARPHGARSHYPQSLAPEG